MTVELFAGIGGFRLACDKLGIKTIWANDIDSNAAQIYQKHNSGLIQGDIKTLLDQIPNHQLLTAGFPCQPFSSAGKKKGINDPRGTLFEIIVQILKTHTPNFFVLENVKRLLPMDKGKHFATILNSLSSLGYLIEWRVLNAKHFALPQHRERIFIIGSKNNIFPKSFLAVNNDFSSILKNQLSQIAQIEKWIDIINYKEKFPNWGLSYNNKFIGYNLDNFYQAQKSVTLKDIIQTKVDFAFDFTEDTVNRLKNSRHINKYYNNK